MRIDEYSPLAIEAYTEGALDFEINSSSTVMVDRIQAQETLYRYTHSEEQRAWEGKLLTAVSGKLGFIIDVEARKSAFALYESTLDAVLASVIMPDPGFNPPAMKITDATIATAVDEATNELLKGGSTFTSDTTKLYTYMTIHNVPVGSDIKVVWTEVDAQGAIVQRINQTSGRGQGTGPFWFSLGYEQGWPPGLYESQIFINDELLATVPFAITRILANYGDERLGLAFSYPQDWIIDDSDPTIIKLTLGPGRFVLIAGAIAGPITLESAVSDMLEFFKEEPGFREISRSPIEGDTPGSLIRFEWSVAGQTILTDAMTIVKGARLFFVQYSALEELFDRHEADFRQVRDSFKVTLVPVIEAIDTSGGLDEILDSIGKRVTEIRGLPALSPATLETLSREQFKLELESEVPDEESQLELEKLKDFCLVLDLCVESDDLLGAFQGVAGEGVLGVYNPNDKTLTVVQDEESLDLQSWLIYAHEYTHALQDQQYDLSTLEPTENTFDASKARAALLEGDAGLSEALFYESLPLEQQSPIATSSEAAAEEFADGPEVTEAPRIIRETFGWEHRAGLDFVFRLYLEGGLDAVDRAYEDLPQSTEQILHPEKYLSSEAPKPVSLSDLASGLGGSWEERDVGVLGELLTGIYLGTFLEDDQADTAAEGWGGDRYALLKDERGRRLMVILFSWDSIEDAVEFFQAYLDLAEEKSRGQWKLVETDESKRWWVGEDISVYLTLEGVDTLLIIAPDPAIVETILPTVLTTTSE